MNVANMRGSRSWLFWTGLMLAAAVGLVMLGSGMAISQADSQQADVEIAKSVNVQSVEPGHVPAPRYTVVFTNTTGSDVILDAVTDTLPTDFDFVSMHPLSDWNQPPDDEVEPVIVWQGPITVPASSSLKLVYSVLVPGTVPPAFTPYVNSAQAVQANGTPVGPVSAELLVGAPELSVEKEAWPERVLPGGQVTYTVVFSNSGQVTGTLESITDTLDPSLTFVSMVAGSDVLADPAQNGNELVWAGPFDVPSLETLTLRYSVQTAGDPGWSWPRNQVEAETAGQDLAAETRIEVGPESGFAYLPAVFKSFRYARLTVAKSADPAAVTTTPGQTVDYTVVIRNEGDTTGTLTEVNDTLPPGFVFQSMVAGSDVSDNPSGTTGAITWAGSWAMPPASEMTLIYRVAANNAPGQYVNNVTVAARNATLPQESASASVLVDEPIAGLSAANDGPTMEGEQTTLSASVTAGSNVTYEWDLGDGTGDSGSVVVHTYPAVGTYTATVTATNSVSQDSATTVVTVNPGILMEDHFESGIGQWTKFLNYWRLTEEQWYHGPNDGVGGSGAATQDCTLGKNDPERGAEDALLMYLGDGAEGWTDYRVETKILLRGGMDNGQWILEGGYPVGLWVRGQYEDVGDADTAGWVTGYYVVIGGKTTKDMFVRLAQLQTLTDCWAQACDNPQNLYDFNNPHTLVQNKLDFSFARNQWYTLVVEVRGDHIMAWVDGTLAIDYVDDSEPFLTGTIGLKTYKSWTVSFDDVIVTPLD